MDLNKILGDLKSETVSAKTVEINVSEWLGKGAILTLKESDTAALFASGALIHEIKKNNPSWPDSLCQQVALLGNCHVSPAVKENPAKVYIELANKRRDCFMYILTEYQKFFASSLGQAADDAKND